jgi:hypothetical protein
MKSLEEAQDWDKLETWMLYVWWSGILLARLRRRTSNE